MCNNDKKMCSKGAERLVSFFDEGTFCEIGAHIKRKGSEELEGVICGYGSCLGKLVFAFSQEPDRMNGAFDSLHAKKLKMLFDSAMKNGAPVVGFFDSVGAVINEGATVLAAYGEVMKAISDASGVIPTVAVISGICGGSSAILASMFDFTVTTGEKSSLYLTPASIGASKGAVTLSTASEEEAYAKVRDILSCVPQNSKVGLTLGEAELNEIIDCPVSNGRCDNRELIKLLCDGGVALTELYSDFDASMITAFATVGGVGVGIIANNSSVNGGKITCKGAKKAEKLISFCDSFGMPVISLVDTDGIADEACAPALARLAGAYISATCAKITLYTGNAIGSAFNLMGSKSCGADMVYALEGSTIATMLPESAVAFIWNDKVGKEKREVLENKWKEEFASPVLAAECGEIDDVIAPCEAKQRICSALMMLLQKSSDKASRKHINSSLC